MSKWLDAGDFENFQTELKEEAEKSSNNSNVNPYIGRLFPTKDVKGMPWKGTEDDPNVYEMRLLPNPSGGFYKKYYYHMIESPVNSRQWNYFLCPKTQNFNNYCPICAANQKLYQGTDDDKQIAKRLYRKEKFITNIFVVDDPRDTIRDEDEKLKGQVMLYEFPGQVEKIIRSQINDKRNGVGADMFNPEDGFNFILKVGVNGDWPVYSTSTFSRRSSAIAEGRELEELMSTRIDINEYFEKNFSDMIDMVEILKAEMVFDLIEDEYDRMVNGTSTSTPKKQQKEEDTRLIVKEERNVADTKEVEADSENIDQDLLDELASL